MINKTITHINFAKGFRGGEKQTFNLIEEFAKQGYQQKLILRKKSSLYTKCLNIKNLEIIELYKPYLFNLKLIKNDTIIYAHEAKAYQFAYIANLIFHIKYIIIRRVDIKIKNNFLNYNIYQNASKVIVLSNAIKQRVLDLNNNINCTIIPDSLSIFNPNKNKINKLKDKYKNKYIVGNIAALEKQKGQQYIINCAKQFEHKYKDIHFLILGTGKDEEEFKQSAKDLTNITFVGFVNNVEDYLSIFNIFVFPTLSEGFGSSILDAMQFNVPVIASNVGGIPDIIQNNKNGILINIDTEELYLKIQDLYQEYEIANKLAKEAYITLKRYNISVVINEYLKIMDDNK